MKRIRNGFTLIELLVVIGIIALLLSISVPALNVARKRAREVANKASLNSMATALESFNNDHGSYPSSRFRNAIAVGNFNGGVGNGIDTGAHILVESMMGLDFIGYQKEHWYHVDDGSGNYPAGTPLDLNNSETRRWGPYVDPEKVELGKMADVHPGSIESDLIDNTNSVFIDSINAGEEKAILYYRARSNARLLYDSTDSDNGTIYRYGDNQLITQDTAPGAGPGDKFHPQLDEHNKFYRFIWDDRTGIDATGNPVVTSFNARPYNQDSFILINAGIDGQYGTEDDITNFN